MKKLLLITAVVVLTSWESHESEHRSDLTDELRLDSNIMKEHETDRNFSKAKQELELSMMPK